VGAPAPGGTGATVAVKVTDWPAVEGFTEETTLVVVAAWLMVMVCVSVEPVTLGSPL
jgi:hypothetical protein